MAVPSEAVNEDGGINWDCPCLDSMRETPCFDALRASLTCVHEYELAHPEDASLRRGGSGDDDDDDEDDEGARQAQIEADMRKYNACADAMDEFQACMAQNWEYYAAAWTDDDDDNDDDDVIDDEGMTEDVIEDEKKDKDQEDGVEHASKA